MNVLFTGAAISVHCVSPCVRGKETQIKTKLLIANRANAFFGTCNKTLIKAVFNGWPHEHKESNGSLSRPGFLSLENLIQTTGLPPTASFYRMSSLFQELNRALGFSFGQGILA